MGAEWGAEWGTVMVTLNACCVSVEAFGVAAVVCVCVCVCVVRLLVCCVCVLVLGGCAVSFFFPITTMANTFQPVSSQLGREPSSPC